MKYRLLKQEELEGLKDEFVQFLIVNGIEADHWNTLKTEQNEKAQGIIVSFSDFILESILNKARYLDFFSGNTLLAFKCNPSEIELAGIEGKRDYISIEELMKDFVDNPERFTGFKQKKEYQPERNMELFNMLESGAVITDHILFDYMDTVIIDD